VRNRLNGAFPDLGNNADEFEPRGSAKGRRADEQLPIVLIGEQTFIRECLVRWLEGARPDFRVTPTETAGRVARDPRILRSAHLIIFSTGGDDPRSSKILDDIDQLTRNPAQTPVVILSDHDELDAVAQVMQHGVRGYIPTSFDGTEVIGALRFVESGGTFIPAQSVIQSLPRTANSELSERKRRGAGNSAEPNVERARLESLTPRENEVLARLRQGTPNKLIAYDLNIAESTVKVLVRRILRKLNAQNRTEVAYLTNEANASVHQLEHAQIKANRQRSA
jgi:DNA-binding NarL/FixJ family response regulator